jgi:hypothetical protein
MGYEQNLANKGLTAAVSQYSHGIREVLSGSSLGWLKSRSIEPERCVWISQAAGSLLEGFFFRPSGAYSSAAN